jgi:hypothetical protein
VKHKIIFLATVKNGLSAVLTAANFNVMTRDCVAAPDLFFLLSFHQFLQNHVSLKPQTRSSFFLLLCKLLRKGIG